MSRDDNLCWFHGRLPRGEAEKILRDGKYISMFIVSPYFGFFVVQFRLSVFNFSAGTNDGVFLVRDSSSSPGDYVLSVLHNVSLVDSIARS